MAYALWLLCLVGMCGIQRLYLGQTLLGLAMLFSFGFCGIGQFLDLLLIPEEVKNANEKNILANNPTTTSSTATPLNPLFSPSQPEPTSTNKIEQTSLDELGDLLKEAKESVERTKTNFAE